MGWWLGFCLVEVLVLVGRRFGFGVGGDGEVMGSCCWMVLMRGGGNPERRTIGLLRNPCEIPEGRTYANPSLPVLRAPDQSARDGLRPPVGPPHAFGGNGGCSAVAEHPPPLERTALPWPSRVPLRARMRSPLTARAWLEEARSLPVL